jgi:hypothetical protein
MKRLMRFRVLQESLVLEGIHLPPGDYDGEISWNDLPFGNHQNRVEQRIRNASQWRGN